MRAEQIVDLIACASPQAQVPGNDLLIGMLAREIAALSYKLTEQELFRLIAVGSLVYERGRRGRI
ncbi:hypothetical protein [Collimonas silvisoli]|uniref:hypothetical protein n=1 Tax=Collimonas silvisoli TaxID=2825884 RepID=UPI001B8B5E6E|nr:hypothetical protein [Collimonas silvisoli]